MSKKELTAEESKQREAEQYAEFLKYSKDSVSVAINEAVNVRTRFNYDSKAFGNNKRYTEEKLALYLANPLQFSQELIEYSKYLYLTSATYNKIINFYANLPTYAYVVDGLDNIDINTEKDRANAKRLYIKTVELLEKMSLRHELQRIMKIAYKTDVFYGYEMEEKDSYFIMSMPDEYCKIVSIRDGVFQYAFDFSFFQGQENLLDNYPLEFKRLYAEAQRDMDSGAALNWFKELDYKKSFAIKINEDVFTPIPPFTSAMESALDEETYRQIKKRKDALDNFMAIAQRIPLNEKSDGLDVFKISPQIAAVYHNQAVNNMPEGVGVLTTPFETTGIRLEKSKRDDDLAMTAKDNTLSNAGLPPNIFGVTNKTAGGIKYAVQYLEMMSFAPLRQIERWINRKLKGMSGSYKFRIRFLDITHYSKNDVFDRTLKAAQFGFASRMEVAASMDMTPLDMLNTLTIENDIFELNEKMIPLSSTHTQSASDKEVGRERLEDQEVTESTETWRENNPDG